MSVIAAVNALSTDDYTVQALNLLDEIVPGTWENTTSFDTMLTQVTGETNPLVVQQMMVRALAIDATQATSYGRAIQVYSVLDSVDQLAAGAAVASKAAGMLGSLFGSSALTDYAPRPETTQCVDAGLKLVGELVAFGLLNGMPSGGDGIARFVGALEDYAKYDLMRIAAWVVFDGVIPLGPDFIGKIVGTFGDAANSSLTDNPIFAQIGGQIPGDSTDDKRVFIQDTLTRTGDFMNGFVQDNGISQEVVMNKVTSVLGIAGGSLDVVAAAIDASTNYMTHTGTQTVGRHLARAASEQLRDEVWKNWVASQG